MRGCHPAFPSRRSCTEAVTLDSTCFVHVLMIHLLTNTDINNMYLEEETAEIMDGFMGLDGLF